MSSSGRPSALLKRVVHLSPSAALMPCSSPLERPSENANTVERSMPITLGLRSSMTVLERLPLLIAPELRLLTAPDVAGRRLGRAPRLEDAPLRRAAERDPLDARRGGRSRRSPRTCRRRRRSCAAARANVSGAVIAGNTGILVVLAHRHDPQVDAVLAHQRRKERVQALASASPAGGRPARAGFRTAARAESTERLARWPAFPT